MENNWIAILCNEQRTRLLLVCKENEREVYELNEAMEETIAERAR